MLKTGQITVNDSTDSKSNLAHQSPPRKHHKDKAKDKSIINLVPTPLKSSPNKVKVDATDIDEDSLTGLDETKPDSKQYYGASQQEVFDIFNRLLERTLHEKQETPRVEKPVGSKGRAQK
jgi:hypothetical protein